MQGTASAATPAQAASLTATQHQVAEQALLPPHPPWGCFTCIQQ